MSQKSSKPITETKAQKKKKTQFLKINFPVITIEKSKSLPEYSSSFSSEFNFNNQSNWYTFNVPNSKRNGFDIKSKKKKQIQIKKAKSKKQKIKNKNFNIVILLKQINGSIIERELKKAREIRRK